LDMPRKNAAFRWAGVFAALMIAQGCSEVGHHVKHFTREVTDLIGVSGLPAPIATSLASMPPDAARIAVAIERQIAGQGTAKTTGVIFMAPALDQLSRARLPGAGFARTGAHLFEDEPFGPNTIVRKTSGRLFYRDGYGRRTSLGYEAQYRPGGDELIIDQASAAPFFAPTPETALFVVEADRLPANGRGYPNRYGQLMTFIAERALPPAKSAGVSSQSRDYAIFVFCLDKNSPTATLAVKISPTASGTSGYEKATRYYDFGGWTVAYLPGRFVLYENPFTAPLYVKTIFTPGKEAGLLRRPKAVGLYHISGRRG
jgi:hypothetical protein